MSREPAILAHIQGGLGNQLFSYAPARAIAERAQIPLRINSRSGFRKEMYRRDYLLGHFQIDAPETGYWEGFRDPLGRSRRSWIRKFNETRPVYLVGYWLDERYFIDARDILRRELTIRDPATLSPDEQTLAWCGQPNSVSVHCRSYREVANPQPGLMLDAAYYAKAFEIALRHEPDAQFVVFSDDTDWARSFIRTIGHNERVCYAPPVQGDPALATLTDFWLMLRCQHHIAANSSFSWWVAWLGEEEGSLVIAPPQGFPSCGDGFPTRWLLTAKED